MIFKLLRKGGETETDARARLANAYFRYGFHEIYYKLMLAMAEDCDKCHIQRNPAAVFFFQGEWKSPDPGQPRSCPDYDLLGAVPLCRDHDMQLITLLLCGIYGIDSTYDDYIKDRIRKNLQEGVLEPLFVMTVNDDCCNYEDLFSFLCKTMREELSNYFIKKQGYNADAVFNVFLSHDCIPVEEMHSEKEIKDFIEQETCAILEMPREME